jgi:hypothetical protein
LTHRSLGHAEHGGDVFLFPVGLRQSPGAQASIVAPAGGKRLNWLRAGRVRKAACKLRSAYR